MQTVAIIQARMGSTRLPGKVLLDLVGKTVLEHIIQRVLRAKTIENVIVATTTNEEDFKIAELAGKMGIKVYRGSENDVLDRYYQAARLFDADHIVRITADCPIMDPKIIDRVVALYFEEKADYCSNVLSEMFPDGEDVEVFSYKVLDFAFKNAKLKSEREHVTPYIRKTENGFNVVSCENENNLGDKRWTLDMREDYDFVKVLYEALYDKNPFFGMEEVLCFLKNYPETEKINAGIVRNEGYQKSLREDMIVN